MSARERIAVALFAACAACAGAPSAPEEAPDPCVPIATDEARLPAEPWVEKLDSMLVHQLVEARHAEAYARCAHVAPRIDLRHRISVDVQHTGGDLDALRAAGLETGLDRDGTVSGIVALGDIEALARLDVVVRIVGAAIAEPTQ